MDNLNLPSAGSLKERGYYFLSIGEYKEAALYFNRALDIDITLDDCYLGLLLSDYQCKDVNDLIAKYAVDFEDNINFKGALRYADEDAKDSYRVLLYAASLICHIKVLENLSKGDYYVLRKRIDCYENFSCKEERLSFVHSFIEDNFFSDNILHLAARIYLYLYDVYGTLPFLSEKNRKEEYQQIPESVKNTVKSYYKSVMDYILNQVIDSDANDLKEKTDVWCNPFSIYTNGADFNCNTPIGLDGCPNSVSERYIYIAKEIEKNQKSLDATNFELICYCYETAEVRSKSKEEKRKALDEKAAFFIRVSKIEKNRHKDTTKELLAALIEKEPDNGDFHFSYVLNTTDFLSAKPLVFTESEKCKAVLSKGYEEYDGEKVNEVLDELYAVKESFENEYASVYEEAQAFAEKAVALAKDEKREEYKAKWESFRAEYTARYNENYGSLNSKIEEVTAKNDEDICLGKNAANKKGSRLILSSVLASLLLNLIPAAVTACIYLKPKAFIEYPILYIYIGIILFSVIFAITAKKVAKKNSEKESGIFERKKSQTMLLRALPHLSSLLSLGIIAFVIFSFIALPSQLGTVKIKNAKQFKYIENCPTASFTVTEDITLKKNSKISLLLFAGKIDGKGHTVNGIKFKDKSFIKLNLGTVKNITFKDMNVSSFCENNYGKLTSLSFDGCKFASSVIKANNKTVKNIIVTNSEFAFSERTKLNEAIVKTSVTVLDKSSFKFNNCQYKGVLMYVSASAGLYLREGPNKYSNPIEIMPQYTTVIAEKTHNGWCYVNKNGTYGWCSMEYLGYEV